MRFFFQDPRVFVDFKKKVYFERGVDENFERHDFGTFRIQNTRTSNLLLLLIFEFGVISKALHIFNGFTRNVETTRSVGHFKKNV